MRAWSDCLHEFPVVPVVIVYRRGVLVHIVHCVFCGIIHGTVVLAGHVEVAVELLHTVMPKGCVPEKILLSEVQIVLGPRLELVLNTYGKSVNFDLPM